MVSFGQLVKSLVTVMGIADKDGSVEKWLYIKNFIQQQIWFFFLTLFVYFLKNCSSQSFRNRKSAEPVFCSEELSCLPYKNQSRSLTLSFGEEKIQIYCIVRSFHKAVLPLGHLYHQAGFLIVEKFPYSLTISMNLKLQNILYKLSNRNNGDVDTNFTRFCQFVSPSCCFIELRSFLESKTNR